MTCNAHLLLAGMTAICLALTPGTSRAQNDPPQVGLFFDKSGVACNGILEPFAPEGLQVHILAFADAGVQLGGAIFRLELPLFVNIKQGSIEWPENSDQQGSMIRSQGLDLRFLICPVSTGEPITLVSFQLADVSSGDIRPDMVIKVVGGTITAPDSLTFLEPNLKICDPNNLGGFTELVVAPSTLATLNCSAGDCPCNETALVPMTWTAVRKLYADD